MYHLHWSWMVNRLYKAVHSRAFNEVWKLGDNLGKFCASLDGEHELSVSPGTSQTEARKWQTLTVAT